jgi:hypothetical protein
MSRAALALAAVLAAAAPASANDSMAELRAGGLVFVQTGEVAMEREDLYIGEEEVRVDYVFRNKGETDETTLVAFPMPDIEGNPFVNVSIPDDAADNFLGFTVTVDGEPVEPRLQQRAYAIGIDVTEEIRAAGLSLLPFGRAAYEAADALPDDVRKDWARRGILVLEQYDTGQGMEDHYSPYWTLKTVYWWETVFPAGKEVRVSHRYKPSVGGTVGLTFLSEGRFEGDGYDDYVRRYCLDDGFRRAVEKTIPPGNPYGSPYFEKRIAYVLTTGQNWAGPIGTFHLTVDKGRPDNIVSFCGTGVEKTGPTTFEMTATDFWPEKDLEILILEKPTE